MRIADPANFLVRGLLIACLALFAAAPLAADDAKLASIWAELSDGDKSAMKTGAANAGTTMQTVKGSPNAQLWGIFTERGLMRTVSLAELFGTQADTFEKAGMIAFAVTPDGAKEIPGIIEELEKR